MAPLCKRIAELSILLALEGMSSPLSAIRQELIMRLHKVAPCGARGILWRANRQDLESIAFVLDQSRNLLSTHAKDPWLTRGPEEEIEKRAEVTEDEGS